MQFNLKLCDKSCESCLRRYIKKYKVRDKSKLELSCYGIPLSPVSDDLLGTVDVDEEFAVALYDPVVWARKMLDWHCLDPDGSVWKRKTQDGTLPANADPYNEKRAKAGKSIFHRPYQAEMLRCTSLNKVFRIGRQAGKTEVLCISMLHAIYTHKDFRVVLITPYSAQINLVFSRVMSMVRSSPLLSNSVARSVKGPNYTLELKNGSLIIGFTAGTSSKQEAGMARGQPANMLVFDEADYLAPGDIQSTLATTINFGEATVWMSSTPTGRREYFYDTCHDRLFREFHFASHVNPNWDERREKYFRSRYTREQYNHEINAAFGAQEEGVYQIEYVEAAQAPYEYSQMSPNPIWTYTIGVDWNEPKIGTSIAVVGYNPQDNRFYVVERHTVSRSRWNQLAACQKVAEVNRRWNACAVYVDWGHGSTNIEVLQEYGYNSLRTHGPNHPDARLRNIVKGYQFGGSVVIRDPWTKQEVKKAAKPFLVENSVRRFESGQIAYPASDENYTKQLLGYIIDRITDAGQPKYKMQNEEAGDHFLDAVNLALVGFTLEKTRFGKPIFSQDVGFVENFGKPKDEAPSLSTLTLFQKETREEKPTEGRAELLKANQDRITLAPVGRLPAANTKLESKVRVWAWDGFLRDEPPPTSRQVQGGRRRLQRRSRPRRVKI
jgi:replicative DNA helicase